MKAGSWVFSIRLVHTTLSFTCTYSVYALSGCSNAPKKGTDWVNERMDARLIAQGRRHPICIRVPPAPHLHHHCSRCEEMSNRELLGVGTEPLVAPFPNVPQGVDIWKFMSISCCKARHCHSNTKCQRKLNITQNPSLEWDSVLEGDQVSERAEKWSLGQIS